MLCSASRHGNEGYLIRFERVKIRIIRDLVELGSFNADPKI